MQILVVKLSSMGDIILTLPAITDAARAIPGLQCDWVVEEDFAEIPQWHPKVLRSIPIALRRWRYAPWRYQYYCEFRAWLQQLRHQHYDYVIDAQALFKSACVTRLSKGLRSGMDRRSVRELGAQLAYQKRYFIPKQQHALTRIRQLFSKVLDYPLADMPLDYGLCQSRLEKQLPCALPEHYLFLTPNSSCSTKDWPESHWLALLDKLAEIGLPVLIPWGNLQERARAIRFSLNKAAITVLPKLRLSEMASVLKAAKAAVCVDTGFSHLAAALQVPTVTLYQTTDPMLGGTVGLHQIHLNRPSVETVWQALSPLLC